MASLSRQTGAALVAFGCLLALIVVGYNQGLFAAEVTRPPTGSAPDLSDHPIYSKYDFGRADNIIDIGTQPLWIPTSIISGAMKRDAVLRKALTEQGLEVRFHPFLKGADVNFFLLRGDLEAGIGGDMPALSAVAASNVLVTTLTQKGFCSIVGKRRLLIKELRGKRIAYAFGSNAHYALLRALSSEGIQEADVRLTPLDVTDMPDALDRGNIDAFSAWEPTPSNALARFENQVIIHRSLCSGYLYFSRLFADRHPEAVRQIVASELRIFRWIRTKGQNLITASRWTIQDGKYLSGQEPLLSAEQHATLAKNDLLGITSVPVVPLSDLSADGPLFRELEFLKSLGKVPGTAGWKKVKSGFDRTIIFEVLSEAKKYQLETYEYIDNR